MCICTATNKKDAEVSIEVREGKTVVRYLPPPGSPANDVPANNNVHRKYIQYNLVDLRS